MDLYSDHHPNTSTKGLGFKDKKKALETLRIIKTRDVKYQKQVVITMYNRARYHPSQTKDMKEAMDVYKIWMIKRGIRT
jgi:hypothetical protein